MEIGSSTNSVSQSEGTSPMKKATEVQSQQVMKVLQGLEEQTKQTQQQTQQMNAQKTGVGNSLNLLG